MPMRAGNKPQERESFYERNEDDIITRQVTNMIMGTGSGKKGNRYYWLRWSHRTVPHGTSQNLRKKTSCHMHVILRGHFLSYNIHHFHIPGQQGGGTHTLRAHWQLTGLTVEDRTKTIWHIDRLFWLLKVCAHYSTKENLVCWEG